MGGRLRRCIRRASLLELLELVVASRRWHFSTEENIRGDRARGSHRDRGRSTRLGASDKVTKRYSRPSLRGTHKEWIPLPQDPPRGVGALLPSFFCDVIDRFCYCSALPSCLLRPPRPPPPAPARQAIELRWGSFAELRRATPSSLGSHRPSFAIRNLTPKRRQNVTKHI